MNHPVPPRPSPAWPRAVPEPVLDMTLEGGFRAPRPRPRWMLRIGVVAALVALAGLGLIGAALAVWLVATLIPVVLVAGLIAWVALRVQLWRTRRGRDVVRG